MGVWLWGREDHNPVSLADPARWDTVGKVAIDLLVSALDHEGVKDALAQICVLKGPKFCKTVVSWIITRTYMLRHAVGTKPDLAPTLSKLLLIVHPEWTSLTGIGHSIAKGMFFPLALSVLRVSESSLQDPFALKVSILHSIAMHLQMLREQEAVRTITILIKNKLLTVLRDVIVAPSIESMDLDTQEAWDLFRFIVTISTRRRIVPTIAHAMPCLDLTASEPEYARLWLGYSDISEQLSNGLTQFLNHPVSSFCDNLLVVPVTSPGQVYETGMVPVVIIVQRMLDLTQTHKHYELGVIVVQNDRNRQGFLGCFEVTDSDHYELTTGVMLQDPTPTDLQDWNA
ncbi:hypothetical protein H1R20_g16454, partial [Candolleomyces eurysporus]